MGVSVSRPLPQHSHPGPATSSSDVQAPNLLAPTEPQRQTLPRADDLQSMCSFLEEVPRTQQLHRMHLAFDMFRSPSMCTPRPLARISLQLTIHRPGASPLKGPSFFPHATYIYSPFVVMAPCSSHMSPVRLAFCTPHDAHRLLDACPQYWRRLAVHLATHKLAKQGVLL